MAIDVSTWTQTFIRSLNISALLSCGEERGRAGHRHVPSPKYLGGGSRRIIWVHSFEANKMRFHVGEVGVEHGKSLLCRRPRCLLQCLGIVSLIVYIMTPSSDYYTVSKCGLLFDRDDLSTGWWLSGETNRWVTSHFSWAGAVRGDGWAVYARCFVRKTPALLLWSLEICSDPSG